jgi:monofunctional biosynthetic peptidoglycan transglycosylase
MIKYIAKIFYYIWLTIKTLLLTYAVVFSIAGTALIIYGYGAITKPFREVKFLIKNNPAESEYMKLYRANLRLCKKPDTLFHRFVPIDSISRYLQHAVIASEDDGFYTHPGFDIEAMLAAAQYNRDKNRIARGASTITQQLAKNLFCDYEKSFLRKFKELGYTLLLEKYLSKDRILELYLNYAQWGDKIFGSEAASREYYKKSCARLTINEASRLAATLAMPNKLSPLNSKSGFVQKRIEVMANNLYRRRMIDDSDYTALCGLPPPKDTLADSLTSDSIRLSRPTKYPEIVKNKNEKRKSK